MILLRYHHGHTVREIAKMLGLSLPAAIKLDQRAKTNWKTMWGGGNPVISKEMLKKRRLKRIRQSGIRSPLQQNVNMSFPHRFREKCAELFGKQNIPWSTNCPNMQLALFLRWLSPAVHGWQWMQKRELLFCMGTGAVRVFCWIWIYWWTTTKSNVVEYDLTWLPGEFHLIDKQAIDGNTLMIYADDSGQRITFPIHMEIMPQACL